MNRIRVRGHPITGDDQCAQRNAPRKFAVSDWVFDCMHLILELFHLVTVCKCSADKEKFRFCTTRIKQCSLRCVCLQMCVCRQRADSRRERESGGVVGV